MADEQATIERTKVTIQFPLKIWEGVERMAQEDKISRTEFLRRAISTEQFRRQIRDEGAELLVRRRDGELEKLLFAY